MQKKDKSNLMMVAIVGIVAIVALMIYSNSISGQAMRAGTQAALSGEFAKEGPQIITIDMPPGRTCGCGVFCPWGLSCELGYGCC